MEIEVFGELLSDTGKEITPLAAKMSSTSNSDRLAENCIDGTTTNGKYCHTAGKETFPWITLVIPPSIVRKIRITNRADCCGRRMKNMKIWVGKDYPTNTSVEYTGGILLGTFSGPGTQGQVLPINTDEEVVGTHVVVQMKTDYINLMEIEVFGEPAPVTEIISPLEAKMSSTWDFPVSNCIDGNPHTMCHSRGLGPYPWITLVIPRSIVRGIRITNRATGCCWDRMKNMKVR